MDNLEEYRNKLKEISDYAFSHGIRAIGVEQFIAAPPDSWDKALVNKFHSSCHDGFKLAQKLLIEETRKYQTLLRDAKNQLKEFNRQKDKANKEATLLKIEVIEQRLHNFSHIADGIAWQLIGGEVHIARRLHIQEDSPKFLDSSNVEHAIKSADEINQIPGAFALISDLTGFVQIGDLLVHLVHPVRKESKFLLIELKEGKVNSLISDFFKENNNTEDLKEEELKQKFDDTTIKQIKRMQRQKVRAKRATDVINNDKGIDPVSGSKIAVTAPKVDIEYYLDELSKLHEELKIKPWAYTVVDTCIHIGMYRDEAIGIAESTVFEILSAQTENHLIIDWLIITQNLSQPIFAKPFPPDFIIDILTGKVKVIIGLDGDRLINTFNVFGLKTRWLTEKETTKKQQEASRKGLLVINKKGIIVTLATGEEALIFGGVLSKLLYDNIKPSSIALSLQSFDINDAKA